MDSNETFTRLYETADSVCLSGIWRVMGSRRKNDPDTSRVLPPRCHLVERGLSVCVFAKVPLSERERGSMLRLLRACTRARARSPP